MDLEPSGDLVADTAVTRTAAGCYDTVVRDGYDAGAAVPNGGLVLALMARAMADTAERPSLLTVTGQYLRRTAVGAAQIATQVRRSGRMVMTEAHLEQAGRVAVHATAVFADRAVLPRRTRVDLTPPDLPPPEACVDVAGLGDADGAWPPVFRRLDHRMPPDQLGFARGQVHDDAAVSGWFRPWVGEPDEAAVPFLMDALFPPVFAIGMTAFAPTIELGVQVRRPPGPGWLRYRFATHAISGGVMEEDGQLWTADGELVALSRQTALPTD